MTRESVAADIVDRLPELVRDSRLNAAQVVAHLIWQYEQARKEHPTSNSRADWLEKLTAALSAVESVTPRYTTAAEDVFTRNCETAKLAILDEMQRVVTPGEPRTSNLEHATPNGASRTLTDPPEVAELKAEYRRLDEEYEQALLQPADESRAAKVAALERAKRTIGRMIFQKQNL